MDVHADLSNSFDDISGYGEVFLKTLPYTHEKVVEIHPNARVNIPTGLYVEIPEGYQISLRPRSGFAFNDGLTLTNCVGTIDSDYRGELMVGLINLGQKTVIIEDGMRICQMLLEKVNKIEWEELEQLSDTDRGTGGFGSTGKE